MYANTLYIRTYVIVSQRVYSKAYVYLSLSIAFVCVSPNSYTLWKTIWDLLLYYIATYFA